jgi:hypothetical protein
VIKMALRGWIGAATVVLLAMCAARNGVAEDRLIWNAKGVIQSITADTLTINKFAYKLTPSTIYEKHDRETSRATFAAGDYVKVTFVTDRSVLKVEEEISEQSAPTSTPAPTAIPEATPEVTKHTARLLPLGNSRAKGESVGSYSAKEGKFTLRVQLPRNSVPQAATVADAKALAVKATITRDNKLVATCTVAFEAKQAKKSVFEFRTEIERTIKSSSSKARSRKGRCVLARGSVGLPVVRAGDLVTVSEESAGEFLRGDF